MSQVTTADVKKLRDLTGAGMLDCKNALVEAGGDLEQAVELLRVKGAKDGGKRGGRTAADGRGAQAGSATLERSSEADFVAAHDEFIERAQQIAGHAAATRPADLQPLLDSTLPDGRTVATAVAE